MARNLQGLFDAAPPRLQSDLLALFSNRASELHWAVEQLRFGDVDRVWTIHGTWRSGKSHFARRLLVEVEREKLPYRIAAVNAFNRGSARGVLREIYFRLVEMLDKMTFAKATHAEEHQRIRAFKPLVDQDRAERSTEGSQRATVQVEHAQALNLGAPGAASLTAGAKGQYQREDAARVAEKQVSLSDRDVVTVLCRAATLLRVDDAQHHVLLFIDDLDLVDSDGVEGAAPSRELLELLRPLAEHRDVVIVATSRHAFVDGRKNVVCDLVELGPLDETDLRKAYDLRVARFHENAPVFDEEALAELIASAQGMVGIFFRNCYEVFRKAAPGATLPLGRAAIDAYARWKLANWRSDPEHVAAVVAVTRAAQLGQTELALPDDLRRSALHLTLVAPTVSGRDVWAINPLFIRALTTGRSAR